jgi:hypothetical protein
MTIRPLAAKFKPDFRSSAPRRGQSERSIVPRLFFVPDADPCCFEQLYNRDRFVGRPGRPRLAFRWRRFLRMKNAASYEGGLDKNMTTDSRNERLFAQRGGIDFPPL